MKKLNERMEEMVGELNGMELFATVHAAAVDFAGSDPLVGQLYTIMGCDEDPMEAIGFSLALSVYMFDANVCQKIFGGFIDTAIEHNANALDALKFIRYVLHTYLPKVSGIFIFEPYGDVIRQDEMFNQNIH